MHVLSYTSETAKPENDLKTVMSVADSIGKLQSGVVPSEEQATANYTIINSIIESRDIRGPSLHDRTTLSQPKSQKSEEYMMMSN